MGEEIYQLVYYEDPGGKKPYREWFEALRDVKAQAVIDARLGRLRLGNFGKCEPVGHGVYELKIYYGPGYRVYFSRAGNQILLLLCGGDKSRQSEDIHKAQTHWLQYKGPRS
ncbi:MAG: type II toxin-antitoxin system RelE/ParE family toxin [Candidatus Omnitrophica bacterium]|nr:type II toxin-antitoxin system RelE/ParE family toxin [Candidatus Omnitrophota bacterium]